MSETSQQDYASIAVGQGILVKALIGGPSAINSVDDQGRSALMLASTGTWRYVDKLLAQGANPNLVDKQGRSALHHASAIGSAKSIERILKETVEINSPDMAGWTPLHWAAHGGKLENVETLLRAGADLKSNSTDGWTPFTVAIYHDRLPTMRVLKPSSNALDALDTPKIRLSLTEWVINRQPWAQTTALEQSIAQGHERDNVNVHLLQMKQDNFICDGCDFVSIFALALMTGTADIAI